ncbi:MAG: hypothetical protein HRF40_03085 [Nitrososphaera sp.]|jgi:hypothetical protein
MQSTKLVYIFLIPALLIAASVGTGVQKVWAEKATLLNDDSKEWKGTSSGYVSPDKKWKVVHPGRGYAKVDDGELKLRPKIDDNKRHSTLVLANKIDFKGIHGKFEVKLEKQGKNPKNWDSFWAMLAYVNKETHIAFVMKTDDGGWKITKRDHDHEGKDRHVTIAQGHQFPEAKKGHWYKVEYWVVPNGDDLHIRLKVDGKTLVDKDDNAKWERNGKEGKGTSNYFLKADKTFGAYCEKSYTSWRNIWVEEVKDW